MPELRAVNGTFPQPCFEVFYIVDHTAELLVDESALLFLLLHACAYHFLLEMLTTYNRGRGLTCCVAITAAAFRQKL